MDVDTLEQTLVMPVITPGTAGITLVTVKVLKVLLPQLLTDCTATAPVVYAPVKDTEIEVVPCPDRIEALVGTVQ